MTRTTIFPYLPCASLLLACADRPLMNETSTASGDTTMAANDGGSDGSGVPTTGGPPPDPTSTGATTPASSTGPDDITTGSDSCGFICDTSSDSEPFCDPWLQDCPEGHKCLPWANDGGNVWTSTKCSPVIGDGQPGEPCTAPDGPVGGVDDCAKGAMCWDVDAENHGTCVEQCSGSPEQPTCSDPENFACPVVADGLLNLCFEICDPLLQDCPGDDLCLPIDNAALCVLASDGRPVFDPCEFINGCDKGLICAAPGAAMECDPMASGCCLPLCDLEDPGAVCPGAGQSCIPLFEEGSVPPKLARVGFCALPE